MLATAREDDQFLVVTTTWFVPECGWTVRELHPTAIIHPDAQHKTWTFLLLGLIFNINALPVNLAYGLGAAWLSRRMLLVQRGMAWLERGAGALFIYFGIRLAISDHPNP